MNKLKLILASLALIVGSGTTWAQTDVTSTYITNPSFETDGAITASNAALTITGWTQSNPSSSYNNTGCYDASTNIPTQGTVTVTPSAGDFFLYFRKGWSANTSYTFTSSETTLPAGAYTLSIDYKMVEGYDNTQNNKTTVTIAAVSGETSLGSATGTTKTNVSGGNAYTYLNTADWSTATANFTLEEATENVQFVITMYVGGQRRSDFVVDNVKLLETAFIDPTAISLDDVTLIPTATKTLTVTYTPTDANHNTAITWTSSDESVATVSAGVVTAVAAGTATITATTANSVSTTCTVTVNEAPIVGGTTDLYLYNEKTGQYLSAGQSWGTHAIVDDFGHELTATLANGAYTLKTQQFNNAYVGSNLYMDNGTAANWLFIETTPGSGKYYLTLDGVNYVTSNGAGAEVITVTTPTDASVWTIVTKNERIAALASATKANPTNATFFINDQNFGRNNQSTGWTRTSGNGDNSGKAGDNENFNWQKWNGAIDYNQNLSGLPNGKYQMKAQGFYRPGANNTESAAQNAVIYAGTQESPIALVSSPHISAQDDSKGFTTKNTNETTEYYVPNSQSNASKAFSAGYYENTVNDIVVTDGTLTIGVRNDGTVGNQWTVVDNFRLYYYGPTLSSVAEALPSTAMTANKWYYYDVPVDGEYDLTVTSLSDIVYTTDETILVEDEDDVTANFTGTDAIELTAGRYYVKSASAQILAIAPHSYIYELGDATLSVADGKYTQNQTFTVTFEAASTNDPDGEAALVASSTATVNGEAVALTAATNGFSLDLGTLTPSTDYEIAIPANVYGYNGESMNSAISLTLHTPAVFDGEYCLYDATNKLFLGRGCAWGTEASPDKYGVPFNLVTNAEGTSSIEFVDWTGVYLFSTDVGNAAGMFTDNASTGWVFVPTTGGYYLKDANGDVYAKVDNGSYGYYAHTVAGTSTATVWTLKTKAERDAIIAAYPTDNISNVITASGISTTADAFTTYLSSNYQAIDKTSSIGTATFAGSAGDWTWSGVRGQDGQPAYGTNFAEVWNATGSYTQTISSLPAGIYKVTVQGYERRKANDAATDLYTAGYNNVSTYLSANGEQVRFTDWNEVDGKPTNTGAAVTAFGNGEAVNTVYVYLDGATDLTLTVKKPTYIWDNWAIFNNFTLTYYQPIESITVTDAGYATYVSDNDLDFSTVENLKAYKATVDGTTITFNKVTTVPAGEGVLLKGEGTFNVPVTAGIAAWEEDDNAFVRGTGAAVASEADGKYNYILNKVNDVVGFFKANDQIVATNHAYIQTTTNAARLNFSFDDEETTGIYTVKTAQNNNAVYNLNGQRVENAKKGLYIQNGKKVIMK